MHYAVGYGHVVGGHLVWLLLFLYASSCGAINLHGIYKYKRQYYFLIINILFRKYYYLSLVDFTIYKVKIFNFSKHKFQNAKNCKNEKKFNNSW